MYMGTIVENDMTFLVGKFFLLHFSHPGSQPASGFLVTGTGRSGTKFLGLESPGVLQASVYQL